MNGRRWNRAASITPIKQSNFLIDFLPLIGLVDKPRSKSSNTAENQTVEKIENFANLFFHLFISLLVPISSDFRNSGKEVDHEFGLSPDFSSVWTVFYELSQLLLHCSREDAKNNNR